MVQKLASPWKGILLLSHRLHSLPTARTSPLALKTQCDGASVCELRGHSLNVNSVAFHSTAPTSSQALMSRRFKYGCQIMCANRSAFERAFRCYQLRRILFQWHLYRLRHYHSNMGCHVESTNKRTPARAVSWSAVGCVLSRWCSQFRRQHIGWCTRRAVAAHID